MNYKEVVEHWFNTFKAAHKISPKWGDKEGKLLKNLIKRCEGDHISQVDLCNTIDYYHAIDQGFEAEDAMWNFGIFVSGFDNYYLSLKKDFNKAIKNEVVKEKREQEYRAQKTNIQNNLKVRNITVDELAIRIKHHYSGVLSEENLKKAITSLRMFRSKSPDILAVKKKRAEAIALLWGKEAYIKAWKSIENHVDPETQLEKLKKQAKELTESTI